MVVHPTTTNTANKATNGGVIHFANEAMLYNEQTVMVDEMAPHPGISSLAKL